MLLWGLNRMNYYLTSLYLLHVLIIHVLNVSMSFNILNLYIVFSLYYLVMQMWVLHGPASSTGYWSFNIDTGDEYLSNFLHLLKITDIIL